MVFCNTTKLVNLSLERIIIKCDLYCNHFVAACVLFVTAGKKSEKAQRPPGGSKRPQQKTNGKKKKKTPEDLIKQIIALPVNRFSTLTGAAVQDMDQDRDVFEDGC